MRAFIVVPAAYSERSSDISRRSGVSAVASPDHPTLKRTLVEPSEPSLLAISSRCAPQPTGALMRPPSVALTLTDPSAMRRDDFTRSKPQRPSELYHW